MKTNPNDPAQPQIATHGQMHESGNLYGDTYSFGGLTKREYFAAMAMQGLCASPLMGNLELKPKIAAGMADALIEALNKK